MKVEAYKCDYCKNILLSEYVSGIINKPDIFSKDHFEIVSPEKTDSHFCFECYRISVSINVQNKMNWREGEKYDEQREKLKRELTNEYSSIFKKEVYRRFMSEKKLKK